MGKTNVEGGSGEQEKGGRHNEENSRYVAALRFSAGLCSR